MAGYDRGDSLARARRHFARAPDHPDALVSMACLAVSYREFGRYIEAQKLYEAILPHWQANQLEKSYVRSTPPQIRQRNFFLRKLKAAFANQRDVFISRFLHLHRMTE